MKRKLFGLWRLDRQGLALISVLGIVSLAMILLLALFSVSDAEFKGANVYADGSTTKRLADSAINIVMGQVQSAATGAGTPGSPSGSAPLGTTIWASQPGAVRVYNNHGEFVLGRTLYSSSKMVYTGGGISGEQQMSDYAPAATWSSNPDQWVDLNAPVTRIKSGSTTEVYFPIFDPRATYSGTLPTGESYVAPEGFSILPSSTGSKPVASSELGVIDATVGSGGATGINSWRVPMPVEWLYVLKDGSVGTVLSAGGGGAATWVTHPGTSGPSEQNPIIGRVGFWTDDECCKININTAGEPGFYAQPTALHDRERTWGDSPPAIFEYQRYPGHPATVALSSVFSPGFDPANYPLATATTNYPFKKAIYNFVPRLAEGGTADGTLPFAPDDLTPGGQVTPALQQLETTIMASKTKPFYASVDEALFSNVASSAAPGTLRPLNILTGPTGATVIGPGMLELSRPFLTAHSRAPETNMFGLPRVAIWPVPDSSSPPGGADWHAYRTGYDSAVATCAKLGTLSDLDALTEMPNSYYFRRLDPTSHLTDMGTDSSAGSAQSGLKRNGQLMNYLDNLVHMTMPGGSSFFEKYNNDAEQILVEIFDYIRCTNLYDGFLSSGDGTSLHTGYPDELRDNGATTPLKLSTAVDPGLLWEQAPKRNQYFTYTPPRFNTIRVASDEGLTTLAGPAAQYNAKPEHPKSGAYPGHGQVKPIEWNPALNPSITFKGFGRFPTISEVALQFICTADGLNDSGSYKIVTPKGTFLSGGKTSERIDTTNFQHRKSFFTISNVDGKPINRRYFSNIPPFPSTALFQSWGCNMAHYGQGQQDDPLRHPGADPQQWNCTLDYDPSGKSGIPLTEGEKRIQICLLIETFVPAVGYTKYVPDYTLVLNGDQISGIKVQDSGGHWKSVFSTTGPQVVQSTYAFVDSDPSSPIAPRGLRADHTVSPLGGTFAPSAITTGRQVIAVGKMPKDPLYQPNATSNIHAQMLNFPLVSNFVSVKRTDSNGQPASIQFKVEKPLEIDIYASHDWQGVDPGHSVPSQRVNVAFPSGQQTTPVPHLVVYSTEPREGVDTSGNYYKYDAVPCVRWWAFNYGGAINRYQGKAVPASGGIAFAVTPVVENQPSGNMKFTYGRFHSTGYTTVPSRDLTNRTYTPGSNGVSIAGGGLVYGYSPISTYAGVLADPDIDLIKADNYSLGAAGSMGTYPFYGTDSIRSVMPRHGDYRILAARKVVDAKVWDRHPVWQKRPNALFAHSLSGSYSDAVVGFDMGGANDATIDPTNRLVAGAWYESNNGTDPDGRVGRLPVVPDTPLTNAAMQASNWFRDWDNGPGNLRDGAYINKPDDGNLSVMQFYHAQSTLDTSGKTAGFYVMRNTYFTSSFLQLPANAAFFTPNRMIASPGVFGSLSTGVWGSQAANHAPQGVVANAGSDGVPFRTLLFRADVDGHVGAAGWSGHGGKAGGGVDPADHYFMDLFFMPVVEPYAITDSYSTAGKINLNYQIVPFTYIRRTTALWAAMKGELITAYSSQDTDPKKAVGLKPSATNTAIYKKIKDVNSIPPLLWTETGTDNIHWYREINVDETLKQMDERFSFTSSPSARGNVGLMLAPSQVCELHLVPKIPAGTNRPGEPTMTGLNAGNRLNTMAAYWAHNDLTGDNVRERPYTNLYQKFTTRSNTFRVFFTAQTIRKARSLAPNQVDTRRDSVTAEYRGSALFERYLDFSPTGSAKLAKYDYGAGGSLTGMPTLEEQYRYRVIETKQFSP